MRNINRILVPTDFSEGARAAYDLAKAFTVYCGGKINLIHIIPTTQYFNKSMDDVGYPPSLDQPKPGYEDQIIARMENELLEYFDESIQGDIIVKLGRKPYSEIVMEAEKDEYGLLVLGKSGSDQNTILGSVAEKIVRHSPKPVLCIGQEYHGRDIKHILVPTDYSLYSFQAIDKAISLAQNMECDITLLYVLETAETSMETDTEIPERDLQGSIRLKLMDKLKTYLEKKYKQKLKVVWDEPKQTGEFLILQEHSETRIPFFTIIQKGVSPHQNISDYANTYSDLVIMNTHGRGGILQLFMGSTTERVIQQTFKPVLSVRVEEEEPVLNE
ncbi:MAG: universal stress protein [Balneolales bacterium]